MGTGTGAYAGLFLAAFLAATLLPAQSETALVALQLTKDYPVIALVAVASLGNVLGSVVNWLIGRGIDRDEALVSGLCRTAHGGAALVRALRQVVASGELAADRRRSDHGGRRRPPGTAADLPRPRLHRQGRPLCGTGAGGKPMDLTAVGCTPCVGNSGPIRKSRKLGGGEVAGPRNGSVEDAPGRRSFQRSSVGIQSLPQAPISISRNLSAAGDKVPPRRRTTPIVRDISGLPMGRVIRNG